MKNRFSDLNYFAIEECACERYRAMLISMAHFVRFPFCGKSSSSCLVPCGMI